MPAVVVIVVVALGLAVTVLVDWQPGVALVGAAMLLAAGLRLGLPASRAGWLVVRSRAFDAALLLVLGGGLVLLAATVQRAA